MDLQHRPLSEALLTAHRALRALAEDRALPSRFTAQELRAVLVRDSSIADLPLATSVVADLVLGLGVDDSHLVSLGALAASTPELRDLVLRVSARCVESGGPSPRGIRNPRLVAWLFGVRSVDAAGEKALVSALERHRRAVSRGEAHFGILGAMRRGLTTHELGQVDPPGRR